MGACDHPSQYLDRVWYPPTQERRNNKRAARDPSRAQYLLRALILPFPPCLPPHSSLEALLAVKLDTFMISGDPK